MSYPDFNMATEKSLIASLASLYAFRMLGLFLIYPVLAIYAPQLPNASPLLLGVALGAYGLSQAILQIPFGMLSDKWGRKPVIVMGLLLFATGSVVAAMSTDIYGLIVGRIIQGTGAISAVITALLTDLLAPEKRSRALAIVGLSIGMAFGLSLILAPPLGALIGLSGLFWLVALFCLLSLGVLILWVPTPAESKLALPKGQWRIIFKNPQLWYLNISAFCLHALLTTLFLWLPPHLNTLAGHWYQQSLIYLVLLFLSYALMWPILKNGEKNYQQKTILQGSIMGFALALLYFASMPYTLWYLLFGLLLFLIPFNLLEAILPSWVSRIAPAEAKGAALGVYASAQFLGIFAGGAGSGALSKYFSFSIIFFSLIAVMLIWFILVRGLKNLSKQE